MSHFVYILYSPSTDKFYIGESADVQVRLAFHNDPASKKFTKRGQPWNVGFQLECRNRSTALLIEKHIKAAKSKKYISNLLKYPEIAQKLIEKYDC